jgi:hypothetical protein
MLLLVLKCSYDIVSMFPSLILLASFSFLRFACYTALGSLHYVCFWCYFFLLDFIICSSEVAIRARSIRNNNCNDGLYG